MVANFCLLTYALVTAQIPSHTDWLLVPRLGHGQELVYRGSYTEEAAGRGVQFSRAYRLENRVFVLDTPPRGLAVAFQTTLQLRVPHAEAATEAEPSSVRLELGQVDLQGRVTADSGRALALPLDGPPTLETGAFVEAPSGRVRLKQSWEVLEANRPARRWQVVGTEWINNASCLKFEGVQQSEDWEQARADRTAWRRRDTIWWSPRLGVAYKVERVIERREPAHRVASQRSIALYELQSEIQYPGQLFEDRRHEILQAKKLADTLTALLRDPVKQDRKPFDNLLTRITYHLENQPPTPYREAVLQVRRRAEAASRGDVPPVVPTEELNAAPTVATLDQPAPDFLATNLLTKETVQLRRWLGHPVLLVFYHPDAVTTEQVLRFAQAVQEKYRRQVGVLALAVSEDAARLQRQASDWRLTLPILSGKGLRQSYGVEAIPKLVLLDAAGVVRLNDVGWGPEIAASITEELQRWLDTPAPPR